MSSTSVALAPEMSPREALAEVERVGRRDEHASALARDAIAALESGATTTSFVVLRALIEHVRIRPDARLWARFARSLARRLTP